MKKLGKANLKIVGGNFLREDHFVVSAFSLALLDSIYFSKLVLKLAFEEEPIIGNLFPSSISILFIGLCLN